MPKTSKSHSRSKDGTDPASRTASASSSNKSAELRRVAEHQRLYALFMQTPAMIAVTRGPEFVFEFANPLYLQVVGKTDQIIGTPLLEVMPELKGQKIYDILQQVYATGVSYIGNEVQVMLDKNNDGIAEELYFNFVYQALKNEEGIIDGFMTHAVEVTDQVLARKTIEKSEARYKGLFNSIDQGFCVMEVMFDSHDRAIDYRFLEINKVFEKQTGLKRAVGKTIRELVPNIESHWLENYGHVALTGESTHFTDSSPALGRWFDVDASRVGGAESRKVAVLFTDITERRLNALKFEAVARQTTDVLESMGDAFFMLDKDWKIIRVNKVHEKASKTKRKTAIGKNFWEVFPAAKNTKYWTEYHKVMETRKPTYFVDFYEPLSLWTEVDAYPTEEGGISVFFRDISTRMEAEEALKRQLEITKTITDNATVCLFMIDTVGIVTYINPAAVKATGYTAQEAIGQPMHLLVHHSRPDGSPYPESECPLVQTYMYGQPNPTHEDIFFRKDGSPFPAMITGLPILVGAKVQGTVIEFIDMTEQKKAQESLVKSEQRFRFMAETMPQKVFTATALGEVDYFNLEWLEYAGLSFDNVGNEGWLQFVHPDDLAQNSRIWQHSIETGEPFELEQRFRRYDGTYRWHISRARAMRDEQGAIVRWLGSNTDVDDIVSTTKRKNELEEITTNLQQQRTELLALNNAKDEFISLASHQLRTPATGVKQYVGIALDGYAGEITPKLRMYLERAYESNDRQLKIIDDLLKVAQVDAGKVILNKQPTNMTSMLREIVDGQSSVFKDRNQKVLFNSKDTGLHVHIDQERLRMVLENIIDNASKYTPHDKNIDIKLFVSDTNLTIIISDQGVGIDKQDQNKLFRKFSRLDNSLSVAVGGSGLGLYWAKKIVDLHGGSIAVKSSVGKGSTFTIAIPM